MRRHRQRRERRSAAYFFFGPDFGFDFFFEACTLSAAGFGTACEPFGLVFFAIMVSCLEAATGKIADRRKLMDGRPPSRSTVTAMQVIARVKNGQ